MSCTGNDGHVAAATRNAFFPVLLLTRCTRAPTKRHSSPVESVLTGSREALSGLIEILKGLHWGHGTIDQG